MAISADQVFLLNRMNSTAQKVQLGTLVQNAETIATVTLAEGNILVGDSGGAAAAVSAKGSGKILVGDGTTVNSVAVSGDATLSTAGVVDIAAGAIVNADVNASAAIAYSKMATMTGDVTMSANASAIGAAKVTKAMLAATVRPSHIVLFAGSFTTAGGDADEQISVPGVVTATDTVFVQLHTKGGTPRTILTAQTGTDVVNLVFSGDPSNDHVVKYQVIRASS